LAGEAIAVAAKAREVAERGRLVLTEPAAAPLAGTVELEAIPASAIGGIWALQLQ
jgi:hypothetical protein